MHWLIRKLLRFAARDSNYLSHFDREYDLLDENDDWTREGTKDLLCVLATQGHSGGSIGPSIDLLRRAALFEALSPLTGEDDEWNDISEYGSPLTQYQNNRCSHVFKTDEGYAYDINGKVFIDPEGGAYTNSESSVPVEFPYTPKTVYIKVDKDEQPTNR